MLSMLSRSLSKHCSAAHTFLGATRSLSSTPKKVLTIAIVGRPNVGKSTLFNRLTKSKLAIVSNIPGTTRDRREGKGGLAGLPLNVIDTGGLDDRGQISTEIQSQVKVSLELADVVIFMLDSREGVTSLDEHFGNWLRKHMGKASLQLTGHQGPKKDIIVLANKAEGAHQSNRLLDTVAEAVKLGLGEPIPISASHGDGLADLASTLLAIARTRDCDDGSNVTFESLKARKVKAKHIFEAQSQVPSESSNIASNQSTAAVTTVMGSATPVLPGGSSIETAPSQDEIDAWENAAKENQEVVMKEPIELEDRVIQMAVMGKPNVGKSTFINSLLKSERMIAGPTPGLTRWYI